MSEVLRYGRFEIKRILGRGGMGTVYEAVDPVIGRVVAIKEIRLETVRDARERQEMEERFRLEFRTAGTLSHPNVVTIYDVGEVSGATFIAMEYVEGRSLDDYLREEKRPPVERVLDLAAGIASGLDFAHSHGIVHRDVKPANVLLTRDLRPKLSDFGLVKLVSTELTTTGTLLGTPAYMAPEQVQGLPVGPASDQFSFAVLIYGMLTGQQPFRAEHPSAILYKIVHEAPDPLLHGGQELLPAVRAVLLRGLAKNPQDRYASCTELVDELRRAYFGVAGALPLHPSQRTGSSSALGFEATLPLRAERPAGEPAIDHFDAGPTLLTRHTKAEKRSKGLLIGGAAAALVLLAGLGGYLLSKDGHSATATPATAPAAAPPAASIAAPPANPLPTDEAPAETAPADTAPATTASPKPPLMLQITSQPSGAAISLDGEDSGKKTPATLPFEPERDYALQLALEGYKPLEHRLAPAELSAQQREKRVLHFSLESLIQPGMLAVQGADYEVQVEIGGKRQKLNEKRQIRVMPGKYQALLVAEAVFLRQTSSVEIESGEVATIRVPQAFPVRIAASPANCRVAIDGRFVDVTPINDRRLVAGSHTFEFTWPAHNRSKKIVVVVAQNDQRIFASLED